MERARILRERKVQSNLPMVAELVVSNSNGVLSVLA
jgi:hypothetical protein